MLLFLPADPALPAGAGGSDRPMELRRATCEEYGRARRGRIRTRFCADTARCLEAFHLWLLRHCDEEHPALHICSLHPRLLNAPADGQGNKWAFNNWPTEQAWTLTYPLTCSAVFTSSSSRLPSSPGGAPTTVPSLHCSENRALVLIAWSDILRQIWAKTT
jgi:hypothetical protein